jgi:hypothetical protein
VSGESTGYAVRRHWPDGAHDFIEPRHTPRAAQDAARRDERYWRRGPYRPTDYRVVAISQHDYDLHLKRHGCRSPDCP